MKKNNFIYIFFGIFAVVGIILFISGFFWLSSGLKFKENAMEVSAEIVDIETYRDSDGELQHRPYITYSVNGTTYTDRPLNSYSSDMYIGQELTILCNPDTPERVMTNLSIYLGGGIFLGMGVIFMLVGIIPIICFIIKSARQKKILQTGQVLYATVNNIVWNTSYSVNGRHPFVIYCTYKDDYQDISYRFKSDNLWTDPSPVFPVGSYIEVYVNPKDYSQYHVNAEKMLEAKIVDYT